MNEKEIVFIICANNDLYYGECIGYIQNLEIPAGYTIDILEIREAASMAEGYNAGMQASSAKYKVYLHQDTFIVNQRFLFEIIDIFQRESEIGMLGVIGSVQLPEDACCWDSWNVGGTWAYNGRKAEFIRLKQQKPYMQVAAIDGMLMVTKYDILWREDILKGWDFYDVSQSIEMNRAGYKVVVPYQEMPWCYHDCGPSNVSAYDCGRRIMMKEYPDIFCGVLDEKRIAEDAQIREQLKSAVDYLVEEVAAQRIDGLIKSKEDIRNMIFQEKRVGIVSCLVEIYEMEKVNLSETHSEIFSLTSWQDIVDYYNEIRFIFLGIAYGNSEERSMLLQRLVEEGRISSDAIRVLGGTVLGEWLCNSQS